MSLLLKDKIYASLAYLHERLKSRPQIAMILGSGLGQFADSLKEATVIDSAGIPHYPKSTVPGHSGKWVAGRIHDVPIIAVQGRVHYYEGYSLREVTYPIHLLASFGVKALVLTTACGGLNPSLRPGDFMLITDQVNFAFDNPLIGKPENQLGPRFPDMSHAFDEGFIKIAERVGEEHRLPFRKGVFCWMPGPAYETAAEVRMLRKLGGDAVSMSTAPEVIVARQRHLRILGISLITNQCTGLSEGKLTHKDVTSIGDRAGKKLGMLLKEIIWGIAAEMNLFD
jgi:purine-nucleoside phosphorylase